ADPGRLTSRPRPAAPNEKSIKVGEEVRTGTNQRRRISLPDGSVLFVNQQTSLTLAGDRRIKLASGEVLVIAAPGKDNFVVETEKREVSALRTAFSVRASEAGTAVLVARGRVKVSDVEQALNAGQRLEAGGKKAEAAPRASYLLDWT